MDSELTVTVFLSHSHRDKVVARRLLRELCARGFRVWLDERELLLGSALTNTIRSQIEAADAVLVVASASSAESKWVGLELEHARAHGRPIVPLFVEPVADLDPFRDHKGTDVPSPQAFGRAVLTLMRGVMQAFDRELPPAVPTVLETGLRALALEERALEPLVVGCLDGEGLQQQHEKSVFGTSFHALDHALNALMELRPTHYVANVAAKGFERAGVGFDALWYWIERSGDGGQPLVSAVGTRLNSTLLSPALELLGACSPANNQALYNFIHRNADQIDAPLRRATLHLVTWPRRGPDRLADTLGRVALEYFPDSDEVRDMWVHWIYDGQFDGDPSKPWDLARELGIAHERNLHGWGPVHDALRNHVRALMRQPSRQRVWTAIYHLRANADERTPVVDRLVRQMQWASASAEWKDWAKEDPQTVEEMRWYVHTHAREAQGDRDWLKAMEDAERVIAFEKKRNAGLTE